jgi:hypothetical protein
MKKALAVGIDEYPGYELSGCANDATEFAKLMQYHGEGEYRQNFVIQAHRNIVSKMRLQLMIQELFAEKIDTVLFYFSGHGIFDDTGAYILTPDTVHSRDGVSMDVILKWANTSPAHDKIIMLDCCNSGAFGAPLHGNETSSFIERGVTILTASNERDEAFQVNGRGVFTNLLLDALRGDAADLNGYITPGSVYTYIDQALGQWNKQRPIFKTNVSRFTILREVKPQVSRAIMMNITTHFESENFNCLLDPSFEDTNIEGVPAAIKPYADKKNVLVFKQLQKLQSVGLVVPTNEEFMYFAAMHSTGCHLTPLGTHYWRLVKKQKIHES